MGTNCFICNQIKKIDAEGLCNECREEKKLIDKIRKLLALTGSPNKAEAELAAQRAHELLTKYNLDIADLQEKEIGELEALSGRNIKEWRRALAINIASLYYCRSLRTNYGSGYYKISFAGQLHNVIIAKSIFEYLEKTVLREARNSIRKNAKFKYRENFKLGMALEISRRLQELKAAKIKPEEKALVVTENKLVEKYLADKGFSTSNFAPDINKKNAFYQGIIAGSKVSLNDQIKNTSEPRGLCEYK